MCVCEKLYGSVCEWARLVVEYTFPEIISQTLCLLGNPYRKPEKTSQIG